jgi:hypothetical protein
VRIQSSGMWRSDICCTWQYMFVHVYQTALRHILEDLNLIIPFIFYPDLSENKDIKFNFIDSGTNIEKWHADESVCISLALSHYATFICKWHI